MAIGPLMVIAIVRFGIKKWQSELYHFIVDV